MIKKSPQKTRPSRRPKTLKIVKNAEVIVRKTPEGDDDTLLTTSAVAAWLGLSHQWLEAARCKQYEQARNPDQIPADAAPVGPRFVRITARLIRYRKGDVLDYLRSRTSAQEARLESEDVA